MPNARYLRAEPVPTVKLGETVADMRTRDSTDGRLREEIAAHLRERNARRHQISYLTRDRIRDPVLGRRTQRIASFNISEAGFKTLFPSVIFSEISTPMAYPWEGFGNPALRPSQSPKSEMKAKSGIFFQKIEKNGGGPTIIFDRDAGIGSYDFTPW